MRTGSAPGNKVRPEGTADFSTFQPRRWFFIRIILLIGGKVSGGNYSRRCVFPTRCASSKTGDCVSHALEQERLKSLCSGC